MARTRSRRTAPGEHRRASRRRRGLTLASGIVAGAIVVGAAASSQGYVAQRLDLSDPSLWVRNGDDGLLGRVNVDLRELDTFVDAPAASVRLVQLDGDVWVQDVGGGTLAPLDQATAALGDEVTLPTGVDRITATTAGLVMHAPDTGGVWVVPRGGIDDVGVDTPPVLELGADSVLAASADLVVGYSRVTGLVTVVDPSAPAEAEQVPLRLGDADDEFAITLAGDDWWVLDATTRELAGSSGTVPLAAFLPADGAPRLQAPSDDPDRVLVADASGLLEVPTDEDASPIVLQRSAGEAIAPVAAEGCVYAAWGDGTAWRECDGVATALELQGWGRVVDAPELSVQHDRGRVLLNDTDSGASWDIAGDGALIDNWDDRIEQQPVEVDEPDPVVQPDPKLRRRQQPPIAENDRFGARPGRATVLPVLQNDRDPNGDALVIESVDAPGLAGTVGTVSRGTALMVRLDEQAVGRYRFEYTVDDGRGQNSTDTAKVVLKVAGPDEQSAPEQRGETVLFASVNGTTDGNVLADWVDPEGDPLYLVGASAEGDDRVSTTPDGRLTFTSGGEEGQNRTVSVQVSDGRDRSTGQITVQVLPRGRVSIRLDPFPVPVTAGEPVTVRPLDYARGGRGPLRLQAVSDVRGVAALPDYERGTVQLTTDQVGTQYIDYAVSDGEDTRTGTFRLEVTPATPNLEAPVAVPDQAFVRSLDTTTFAPLANDVDPSGGVLSLTSLDVLDPDLAGSLRLELIDGRFARVTLLEPANELPGPVDLEYTVTNGAAESTGVATVFGLDDRTGDRAPIVVDDTATVRVGGEVSIPVLRNDASPDGSTLTLSPDLPGEPLAPRSGYAFTSGDRVRFLAPDSPGTVALQYNAAAGADAETGDPGTTATGVVTVTVIAADPATNRTPIPETVAARVFAGDLVRIRIPLAGIDPDGDAVSLLAQQIAPSSGAVENSGSDWIEYRAGPLATGTDRFPYTVVDDFGAQATGYIEVGVSERPRGGTPVAAPDAVLVRPGGTVIVDALANDSDPRGRTLAIDPDSLDPSDDRLDVTLVDGRVRIDVPEQGDALSVGYTLAGGPGSPSSRITIEIDPEAPLHRPELQDIDLDLSDVLGRDAVDVDVLDGAFFADGDVDELELSLVSGFASGVSLQNGVLTAPVQETTRLVPFVAANPLDPELSSTGLVRIPGLSEALPQLDRTAPPVQVVTGERVVIELDDQIVSTTGAGVRLVDPDAVVATHADGGPLVVDDDTVQYVSAADYFGPATITVEVTDTEEGAEDATRVATIVIPITVTPRENQPPRIDGAAVSLEPGGDPLVVDLAELVEYPGSNSDLVFRVGDPLAAGVTVAQNRNTVTLRADPDAPVGSVVRIPIAVRDTFNAEWDEAAITATVVSSSAEPVVAAPDSAVVERGETTVVDVLRNDANPFDSPLRVRRITGLDASDLPAGVRVVPSADRSEIEVAVGRSAEPGEIVLQYQVADATGDPDRFVWGLVTLSIRDVPDQPAAPQRATSLGFESGRLTLTVTPPESNNSPITGYRILGDNGYRHECGDTTLCTLTDLVPGRRYTFRVVAINGIGASEPSAGSDPLSADTLPSATGRITVRPSAAAAAPNGKSLDVSWNAVADPRNGSAVKDYLISVDGLGSITRPASTSAVTINDRIFSGMQNNVNYTVTVIARNSAQVLSADDWNRTSASGTTVGPPPRVTDVQALVDTQSGDGSIRVNWTNSSPNGSSTLAYYVGRYTGAHDVPSCTPANKPALLTAQSVSSGYRDSTAVDGESYTYVVYADNGLYCTAATSALTTSKATPGTASMRATVEARGDTGRYDIRISDPTVSTGTADYFQVTALPSPGEGRLPDAGWIDGATYGQPTTVTLRGCRSIDNGALCGQASAEAGPLTPVDTRGVAVGCTLGDEPRINAPANVGDPQVDYAVAYRVLGAWTGFDRTGDDDVPLGADRIRVKATVTIDGLGWTDPAYSELDCGLVE